MPHISHMCQLVHAHIWDNYVSIYATNKANCNQQCLQEHWYTFPHYWNMPLNKYISHLTHTCPTVLLLWYTYRSNTTTYVSQKYSRMQLLIAMLLPHMCQHQICSSIATYANYFMCRYETAVYLPLMNPMQSTVGRNTDVHIFHNIGICPWTNMPFTLHMSDYSTTVVYI